MTSSLSHRIKPIITVLLLSTFILFPIFIYLALFTYALGVGLMFVWNIGGKAFKIAWIVIPVLLLSLFAIFVLNAQVDTSTNPTYIDKSSLEMTDYKENSPENK